MNYQNQIEEKKGSDLQIKKLKLTYIQAIRRFSWEFLTDELKIERNCSFVTRAQAMNDCEKILKQYFNKDIDTLEWIT